MTTLLQAFYQLTPVKQEKLRKIINGIKYADV